MKKLPLNEGLSTEIRKLISFEVKRAPKAPSSSHLTEILCLSDRKNGIPKSKFKKTAQSLVKAGVIQAKSGLSFCRAAAQGSVQNALVLGAGKIGADARSLESARTLGAQTWTKLCAEKVQAAYIDCDVLDAPVAWLGAFAEGMAMVAYRYERHRGTGSQAFKPFSLKVLQWVSKKSTLVSALKVEMERVGAIAQAVYITRQWSNEPPNVGTPEAYADNALAIAKKFGLKCTVLDDKAAAKEKMHLFLSVGQGSARESRVVVLEYLPKGFNAKTGKTLALVGKGVTFDTGGISIKGALNMETMKHDMTGAATVMGAMVLASLWKVPNRVVAVMVFSENMPDGAAIVPGSVIKARNGKTVEVINTDAEGRLILADALDYAQDLGANAVINIATLTGAMGICLGRINTGLFSNDEAFSAQVKNAAAAYAEKVWELPATDDYFEELKTEWADMKNVGPDGMGGSIRGAVFLKQFIRKGMPWAHLDIAYTGTNMTHLSYVPKRGASGLHVRTLAELARIF